MSLPQALLAVSSPGQLSRPVTLTSAWRSFLARRAAQLCQASILHLIY